MPSSGFWDATFTSCAQKAHKATKAMINMPRSDNLITSALPTKWKSTHINKTGMSGRRSRQLTGTEGAAESEITGVHEPLLLVALNRLLSEPERFPIDARPRRDGPEDNAARVDEGGITKFTMRTSDALS
jgi:hypothetical protein